MMSNPFQLQFTLRQHTPIIHFQWHEKDATIRPTELKAKLDKWLISQLTGCYGNAEARLTACMSYRNESNEQTLKKWLKGAKEKDKTHAAFNYSIRVNSIGTNSFSDVMRESISYDNPQKPKLNNNDFPTYFGNQIKVSTERNQTEEEYKNGKKRIKRLAFHSTVQITISSPFSDLINEIQKQFPLFLLKTNFGTRQGKGFGSFYLDNNDELFPKDIETDISDKFDWKFDVSVMGNNDTARIKDLFTQIDLFYKTLRSGINLQRPIRENGRVVGMEGAFYFKSIMFQYVTDERKLQWDKKTIKQKYFLDSSMNSNDNEFKQKGKSDFLDGNGESLDPKSPLFWEDYIDNDKFLWRDLLGLSSQQDWQSYRSGIVKQHFPTGNDEAVTRFKSPIFFKPIRTGQNSFRVFFEVPKNIKDAFADETKRHLAEESAILGKTINIDTSTKTSATWGLPFPDTFDFDGFLKYVLTRHPKSQVHNAAHRTKATFNDLLKMKAKK